MFNPKARWDRDLPGDGEAVEDLDEPIWVSAVFKQGRVLPRYKNHAKKTPRLASGMNWHKMFRERPTLNGK